MRFHGLLVDVSPLRHDRDFRLLWSGQLVSGIGRQITVVALPFQLYLLTGSPLAIGLLAVVQLVPLLTVTLVGGALADALDRRRLLIATQILLACCSLLLAGLAVLPAPPLPAIYLVAFLATAIGSVDQPTRGSLLPRIVARERFPAALALNQAGYQAASIVGPAIGGVLLATVGVAAAYFVDALSFSASILAAVMLRPVPVQGETRRPGIGAIVEGLRFARRHRPILGTFVIDLNAMVFGMPTALFPILALEVFRTGPEGVGLLAAAPAVGALLGALLGGWVGRIDRQGRAVFIAVAVWGLAIALFGLSTGSFALALLLLAVAGAADVISAVLRNTIVQLAAPDHLRGRLSSLHVAVVTSGPRLGDVEATSVAAAFGAQFSVVSGGVLCLLGLGLVAWRFPELLHHTSRSGPVAVAAGNEGASPVGPEP
jgi:MFS family permease